MMSASTVDTARISEVRSELEEGFARLDGAPAEARERLLASARRLVHLLETPNEFVMRSVWAEPGRNAAVRIALDTGIVAALSRAGGGLTLSQLAATAGGADALLLTRVMKHLAAMHVVDETGPGVYAANALTRGLADPTIGDGVVALVPSATPVLVEMPGYLASTRYRNPIVGPDEQGPFQLTHGTSLNVYGWLSSKPELGRAFANYMTGHTGTSAFWAQQGFRPAAECLAHPDLTGETPLVVDVGGGLAHDLHRLGASLEAAASPLPGRLICQDLGGVVDQAAASSSGAAGPRPVEFMLQDFLQPQPVAALGARAYHMHHILHCFDDGTCLTILRHVRDAMRPGFSKLLLFENVVPEVGASWKMTALDCIMMANCGSMERTEEQWRELLGEAGLKISEIFSKDPATESLIEVELKEE